jgi:hypothetical protein
MTNDQLPITAPHQAVQERDGVLPPRHRDQVFAARGKRAERLREKGGKIN